MINLNYPHPMTSKEKRHFLRMWRICILKKGIKFINPSIIYGTGGETDKI